MIKGLRPKEHAIFLRNEYKDMPLKQIAKIVGVSRQAAVSKIHKGAQLNTLL
ncbi:hypothetical protein CKO50_07405 [Pseudoalteromonas sp. HM-SA03]|uniref:sigma factor-like helix-turn-helix DNA-binding protein n=1 Tax=Pseudoalteromonas sp. HM-SA03 TaxID=2029678 RepID=UPI000BAE46D4|nr:hypothetical protein CKO50_07405 [Pseudoalteromonas sp. HM-SA03]